MMRAAAMIGIIVAGLVPAQAGGRAPDYRWRVLSSSYGATVFAGDPVRGPRNAKRLTTLTVVSTANAKGDNQTSWWTVDCNARTIVAVSSQLARGTVKLDIPVELRPSTPTNYDDGGSNQERGDFACDGTRESTDPTTFASHAEAVVYGRQLAIRSEQ